MYCNWMKCNFFQLIVAQSHHIVSKIFFGFRFQVMASPLYGTNPLPEPMLTLCQLYPKEQTLVKFQWQYKHFHSKKYIWICHLQNCHHFIQCVPSVFCLRGSSWLWQWPGGLKRLLPVNWPNTKHFAPISKLGLSGLAPNYCHQCAEWFEHNNRRLRRHDIFWRRGNEIVQPYLS